MYVSGNSLGVDLAFRTFARPSQARRDLTSKQNIRSISNDQFTATQAEVSAVSADIEARFCQIDKENSQKPGESRGDFYLRLLRERQEQLDALDSAIIQAAQNGGNDIKLTDEQKEYFSETYDLKNMSQEEYDAILADLERMNILSRTDTQVLRHGTSLHLNGIWEASSSQPGMSHQFEHCNGNLLDWTRFRASYECLGQNGIRYKDGTALLFDKLYRVLTQI